MKTASIYSAICYSLLTGFSMATVCAAQPAAPAPPRIGLTIAGDNLQQLSFAPAVPDLEARIRDNLGEWGYLLPASGPYSHQLQAGLGVVSRQSTPIGFSFSTGNSDPRAIDYQKAEVLPIRCRLIDNATHAVPGEKTEDFAVNQLQSANNTGDAAAKLADRISTVCLEALEQARLQKTAARQDSAAPAAMPKWLPNVRVETRTVQPPQPAAATAPPVDAGVQDDDRGNKTPAPAQTGKQDDKKEIIIYNQGTPLYFQFGPDRR